MHTLQAPPDVTSLAPQVPSVPWSEQAIACLATRKVSSEELFNSFDLVLDATLNAQSGYTDDEKLKVSLAQPPRPYPRIAPVTAPPLPSHRPAPIPSPRPAPGTLASPRPYPRTAPTLASPRPSLPHHRPAPPFPHHPAPLLAPLPSLGPPPLTRPPPPTLPIP